MISSLLFSFKFFGILRPHRLSSTIAASLADQRMIPSPPPWTIPISPKLTLRPFEYFSSHKIKTSVSSGSVPSNLLLGTLYRPRRLLLLVLSFGWMANGEWVEPLIDLDFSDSVKFYADLLDSVLWTYLDNESKKTKKIVTLDVLDELVKKELRMNMVDSNANSRVKNLFTIYLSLLHCNGLKWLIKVSQRVVVFHVLSAIWPKKLRAQLESDLSLSPSTITKTLIHL